jgi:hypothetical protein
MNDHDPENDYRNDLDLENGLKGFITGILNTLINDYIVKEKEKENLIKMIKEVNSYIIEGFQYYHWNKKESSFCENYSFAFDVLTRFQNMLIKITVEKSEPVKYSIYHSTMIW